MKRIVWTFGLISGGIMAAMMAITIPFSDHLDKGLIVGYTTMVVAFLMVYFGIRSYRDNVGAGAIGFGRAFAVGILITLIASACYVASWEIINHTMLPDFAEKYAAAVVQKARASGASEAQIAAQQQQMAQFVEAYKNPIYNVGMTFIEVFPVGLVVVLVSAGILRKRPARV
jgi:Protein of unknown function (DUF4199)